MNKQGHEKRAGYLAISEEVQRAFEDSRPVLALESTIISHGMPLFVHALLENDLGTAYAYMVKAIDEAPRVTGPWVNLGVIYGRNEQLDEAKLAHRTALKINANEYAAMSNLYEVYLAQEDFAAAEEIQRKVERYRQRNPYYLLQLSDEALEQANFEESSSLLKRAIKKKEDEHLLHFALAKTQYLSGQRAAAQISLDRARQLAPEDMLAHYARPLQELIGQ